MKRKRQCHVDDAVFFRYMKSGKHDDVFWKQGKSLHLSSVFMFPNTYSVKP